MDPVVFLEKVRRPEPRGLRRRRLEDRLLSSDAPPLGLVLGAPGSGKTTLLTRVADAYAGRVAWYRTDAEDDDEAALVRHLNHAIAASSAAGAGAADGQEPSVAALVGRLQSEPGPLLLVLDDLHEVAGTAAERALERLIALRPRHVRLLLGSRRPPLLNTTRLLVSGDLLQLDGEDLRFRSWEVEELFRTVYRQPLSPETSAALTRRTGGWAAGLQLFHLGSSGLSRGEREQAVAELSGRSRLIRSYLARNVLGGLDDERRTFLLGTCALGVLTGETCDALLGRTGSAAVLDDLEQQHFFTTSTDDGRTFRYHQVLQTHLEVLLVDELGAGGARALYARSAALLERSGRTAAAARAHARAEDWVGLARLLPQTAGPLPDEESLWAMLRRPGAPLDDPGLVVAYARRLWRHGLVAEAVTAFEQAETLMDDLDFRDRCVAERRSAALWLPDAEPGREPSPGQDAGGRLARDLRLATRHVRHPERAGSAAGRAVGLLLAGDPAAAARALAPALSDDPGPAGGARGVTLVAQLVAQVLATVDRPGPSTAAGFDAVAAVAEAEGLTWLARVTRGLQGAALVLAEPGPDRLAACADLLADAERTGEPWSLLLVGLAVGAVAASLGHDERAVVVLRRAEQVAVEVHAPVLQVWAAALRVATAVATGQPSATADAAEVTRWAEELGVHGVAALLRPGGLRPVTGAGPRAEVGEGTETGEAVETGAGVGAAVVESAGDGRRDGVAVRCLGGFSLTLAGVQVGWAGLRPRARALLMMLAVHHDVAVHREQLVDALWPDADLAAGIRSLQVAVSSVRHCLALAGLTGPGPGEDALRRQGEAYVLSLPQVDDQRHDFETLARAGDRQAATGEPAAALRSRVAAVALYAGDLLPEVGPAEWVVDERQRLHALAARTACGAAELALALGETAVGLAAATRSVELDAYQDVAWTLLAALHEREGDLSAAEKTRREHQQVRADLGLPPELEPRLIRPPRPVRGGGRARV